LDFNGDTEAVKQDYEYMFGKAFLVAPITEPARKNGVVYLPVRLTGTISDGDKFTEDQQFRKNSAEYHSVICKSRTILPVALNSICY
jgi:alpha-glucosidase (family GH31 glycosyl hydrolase)